ncbi:MAG: PEGA domain-containing protein [Candidatus Latescibacteria bacterium]|nr:PEGA domain-containing protein [Candidatus Latescibacterota bacterium]
MKRILQTLTMIASLIILCTASPEAAEILNEMEVIDRGLAPVVVRNPEESILIVTSVIPKLSFASNMGIIRVNDDTPGKWIVYLHPGTNLITFMAEGYKSVSSVRLVVPKKKARNVEVKVLKTRGTLIVESDPSGAAIFLNGEDTEKRTPYEFEGQETGTYGLALRMLHYLADTTEVEVKAGEITRVTRPLQALGYLSVHTVPSEADVSLDSGTGEVITATTPIEQLPLKTGAYSLSVHKPGYLGWKLSVTIEKGQIVQKDLDLQPEGKLGAQLKPKKSRKWPWIVSGAVLVAGGVAAVMLTNGNNPPENGTISDPPSHP